jgi:mannose-6-phosphate isomerase-like protein (cupin superfamily)
MKVSNSGQAEYRYGDWGPAYLLRDPSSEIGVFRLRPGDAMENHYHEHCDESFVVLEGRCRVWIDESEAYVLGEGDLGRCPPGEHHYFVNDFDEVFRAVFVKSPAGPGDTINVPWTPA